MNRSTFVQPLADLPARLPGSLGGTWDPGQRSLGVSGRLSVSLSSCLPCRSPSGSPSARRSAPEWSTSRLSGPDPPAAPPRRDCPREGPAGPRKNRRRAGAGGSGLDRRLLRGVRGGARPDLRRPRGGPEGAPRGAALCPVHRPRGSASAAPALQGPPPPSPPRRPPAPLASRALSRRDPGADKTSLPAPPEPSGRGSVKGENVLFHYCGWISGSDTQDHPRSRGPCRGKRALAGRQCPRLRVLEPVNPVTSAGKTLRPRVKSLQLHRATSPREDVLVRSVGLK